MYRVLIADGDGAFRDLLAQALTIDDCQVEVVERGEEVVRRVAAGGVDVLVSEVYLPDLPAWDLISKVHQIDHDLPVIVVTADDSWETARRVRTEGGAIFFYGLKPLNLREMKQVVDYAARWRQRRVQGMDHAGRPARRPGAHFVRG